MKWFQKEENPTPETKPAEKPAEQTAAQADEMLAKMRTTFEDVVKPLREKVESYEARFNTIEESTRKPAPKTEPTEISSVLDDEDRAFGERLAPLQTTVSQLAGQFTEDRTVNEITAEGWAEIVPELREKLSKIHPMYKASPDYPTSVRAIADGIIGARVRAKGLKADPDKKTYFFAEDSGSTNGTAQAVRISAEDLRTMDRLGIKPDQREQFLKDSRPA